MRGNRFTGAVLITGFLGGASQAAPPPDADPALAPWFRSLTDPETSISCCGESDCRVVEARIEGNHYEASLNGRWIVVPADKVIRPLSNPTGQAVLCYSERRGVMCFVPGPGV